MPSIQDLTPIQQPAAPESGRTAGPTREQLKTLAAQFEALLVGQMLKQMQSSMFGDEDDASSGFAQGPLADAMYSQLSQALSGAGGFGLSDSLLGPLMRQAASAGVDTGDLGMTGTGLLGAPAVSLPAMPSMPLPPVVSFPALAPAVALPVAAPVAAPPAEGVVASPMTLGRVSSAFGWRQDPFGRAVKFHKGTDIAMPVGQEVPVAQSGRVVFAGEQSGYGMTVLVEHGPGLRSRYAHLSELSVGEGDEVILGQTIGKSGSSGRATGPHLHFEVTDDGEPVDPAQGLARLGTSLVTGD